MKRLVLLASGRGSNAAAIVAASKPGGVLDGVATVAAIVANVESAKILVREAELGVPMHVLPSVGLAREIWEERLLALLPTPPDYWVLAGFMRILSATFVDRFPERIVNIHPADTRQHQGLHGYAWAFERKLEETFVTVHLVDHGLDTGRVLARERVDLRGASALADVEARGLAVEHRLYPRALRGLCEAGAASRASDKDGV